MPEISEQDYRTFLRLQDVAAKYDGPDGLRKKIETLETDNAGYRSKVKELEGKQVPEGAVVLTGEEATAYPTLKELGKPEEIKGKLEKLPTLEAEIARRDREAARDAAARALGIEGNDLRPFAGSDALSYETREEEVELQGGKREKRPVPYVKDGEGKEHKLVDFGKAQWGRPFEALLSQDRRQSTQERTPTPFPRQTPDGAPAKGERTDEDFRKATEQTVHYAI